MTLKQKSLVLFCLAFTFVAVLILGLRFWVLDGILSDMDRQYAEHLHILAREAFDREEVHLKSTVSDWAYWDDTYEFLTGENTGYASDNLNQPALDYIGIDLLALYEADGQYVMSVTYDHENKVSMRLKQSPENWLTQFAGLDIVQSDQAQVVGVIVLDEGPMLIAASPVLRNDYSGPSAGVLIMGQFLGDEFEEYFSDQVREEVTFMRLSAVNPKDLFKQIPETTSDGEAGMLTRSESGKNRTYSILFDPSGEPVVFLTTSTEGFFAKRFQLVTNVFLPIGMLLIMLAISAAAFNYQRLVELRIRWLQNLVEHPESQSPDMSSLSGDEFDDMARQYLAIYWRHQNIANDALNFFTNCVPGFMIIDRNGAIQRANSTASEILQVPTEQLIGRSLLEFSDDKQKIQEYIDAWPGQKSAQYDLEIHPTGTGEILLSVSSISRFSTDGACIGAFLVFENVTELRRKEDELVRSESALRGLLEGANVGVFLVDTNGHFLECNHRMQELFQKDRPEMVGQAILLFFDGFVLKNQSGKDFMNYMIGAIGCMMKGECQGATTKIWSVDIQPNGETIKHLGISIFPILTESGYRMGGIITDITEQKLMEEAEKQQRIFIEALRDTSEALNSVLDFDSLLERILINADRVVSSDAGAILLLENGLLKVARSRGYIERGLKDLSESQAFPITDMVNMVQMANTGQPLAIPDTAEFPEWNPLPENRWVRSYIGMPLSFRDRTIGFLSLFHATPGFYTFDHAERLKAFASQTATAMENARLYAELLHKADTDELTGLRNRRSFFELGGREVERAIRFKHPLSAMMIDLDYFKQVNDTFGHPVGDRLMVVVADQFRKNLRNVDLVARYGGDEFVALLPENDLSSAMEVAHRLKKAIESASVETAHGKAHVGVSIGVAELNENSRNLSALIESADRALYHAKQYGRSRVVKSPS